MGLLELQEEAGGAAEAAEAAAGGRSEGPLGVGAEVVVPQPATGRLQAGGCARARHPPVGKGGRGRGPRGVRGRGWQWQRRQASKQIALCVCAGCVWAVPVRDSSETHAGNGWSRARRGRGAGVEMLPRNEEGLEMHGSVEGWE